MPYIFLNLFNIRLTGCPSADLVLYTQDQVLKAIEARLVDQKYMEKLKYEMAVPIPGTSGGGAEPGGQPGAGPAVPPPTPSKRGKKAKFGKKCLVINFYCIYLNVCMKGMWKKILESVQLL